MEGQKGWPYLDTGPIDVPVKANQNHQAKENDQRVMRVSQDTSGEARRADIVDCKALTDQKQWRR